MARKKPDNADLLVKARETYDERDYISVHRKYLDRLHDAIRDAHLQKIGAQCICIYCRQERFSDSASEVRK